MKLKELRKKRGLSQEQAASALGISMRAYQNYEYGQREPSIETILKLADFYRVTTDYLLGREPKAEPEYEFDPETLEERFVTAYKKLDKETRYKILEVMKKAVEENQND